MKSYKVETLLRGSLERLSLPQDSDSNTSVEITAIIELWELPQTDATAANIRARRGGGAIVMVLRLHGSKPCMDGNGSRVAVRILVGKV
ncbi:MAG: hypothetical protein LBU65_16990 [Planctomycetaceae bacterium]|nr:hypothetical protein [Planctomycetaceae bacterium]